MNEDGIVLVVGSGGRQYREYLLAGAARRAPLWLLDAAGPTWQHPYVRGHDVVELVDRARLVPDQPRLVEAAHRVARRRAVAGTFTYDETLVTTTARIAEELGLPGPGRDAADRCRNKHRCRQALRDASLPQPAFELVATLAEARAAAGRIGYPLVLKPRGMGASIGVVRADGPDDLAAAFESAERASHGGSPDYEGGVLVEEYMRGPEISVDGAVFDGEYRPFLVARKETGLPPFFEETGHVVDARDPLLRDPDLADVLTRSHRALGLRYAMTHTEVRFTERGPVVIEVNARLGGDLIPYLGLLATGIDAGSVAVDVATGTPPALTPSEAGVVGIRFAYPAENCTVGRVTVPAPDRLPGLVEAAALVEPGEELLLPPAGYDCRCAYVICRGTDVPDCVSRLDAAVGLVTVEAAEPADVRRPR